MVAFKIIWPETREVSGDWILIQFSDAVSNGDVTDDDIANAGGYDPTIPSSMARILDQVGLITLAKP